MHPAALTDDELLAACDIRFTRRGGPGGQHRNKTETAVVITYRPADLSAEASERRSQADNRREAIFRMRLLLAVHVRTPWRAELLPSFWSSRTRSLRLNMSAVHRDFPSCLALALDAVMHHAGDTSAAAGELGITSSQLVKLLRQHAPALQAVNSLRDERDLHRLT